MRCFGIIPFRETVYVFCVEMFIDLEKLATDVTSHCFYPKRRS